MNKNIIEFNSGEHLVKKAGYYVDNIEQMMAHKERAIPQLIRALVHADDKLKQKIIVVLAAFSGDEIFDVLYAIIKDPKQSDEIRHFSSVQFSATAWDRKAPGKIVDTLINDLKSRNPQTRNNAAFSLGWEGNTKAAIPLIELLYDRDQEVRQAAVNALFNLGDDRILALMVDRLKTGSFDQQKTILFNLLSFKSRHEEVVSVYLDYLEHPDDELRFDALFLLGSLVEAEKYLNIYAQCLDDHYSEIRKLALQRLSQLPKPLLLSIMDKIETLMSDPDPEIKKIVRKLINITIR
jgi:vesicle coat complex subunit